jgi:hypothetical protein
MYLLIKFGLFVVIILINNGNFSARRHRLAGCRLTLVSLIFSQATESNVGAEGEEEKKSKARFSQISNIEQIIKIFVCRERHRRFRPSSNLLLDRSGDLRLVIEW